MSRMDSSTAVRRVKPSPNVYTVLAVVAFIALAIGVGVLWQTNTSLTGEGNPFHVVEAR